MTSCNNVNHCPEIAPIQTLVDAPNHKKSDPRRARSGLVNLAPTSTGSATAIALIYPELKGEGKGGAVHVSGPGCRYREVGSMCT